MFVRMFIKSYSLLLETYEKGFTFKNAISRTASPFRDVQISKTTIM